MAQPATRSEFKNYLLRQLGAPVLEINVADEQVDDIIDDALQYFHERHFDGVLRTYLKYQVTQNDIDRGKGPGQDGVLGIVTTTASSTIDGSEMQIFFSRIKLNRTWRVLFDQSHFSRIFTAVGRKFAKKIFLYYLNNKQ